VEFFKGFEIGEAEDHGQAMKRNPDNALRVLEICSGRRRRESQKPSAQAKAKWCADGVLKRSFNNSETMEKLHRWCDGNHADVYEQLFKIRNASGSLWQNYDKESRRRTIRTEYQKVMLQFEELRGVRSRWATTSRRRNSGGSRASSRARLREVARRPQGGAPHPRAVLNARKSWDYTFDEHYLRNGEFLKFEKVRVEEDAKLGDKRKATATTEREGRRQPRDAERGRRGSTR
jgi:hypothetical protein